MPGPKHMLAVRPQIAWLLGLVLAMLFIPHTARAYSVVLRWQHTADARVAGYRAYIREQSTPFGAPIDVPSPNRNGTLYETTLGPLQVEKTYLLSLSAYTNDGVESARSNEILIGYAKVAHVVDSDGDELTDAEEDLNLNGAYDGYETNRLDRDTDGDLVDDGAEVGYGSDPTDASSPVCESLDMTNWLFGGGGTGVFAYEQDLEDYVLTTTAIVASPTRFRSTYPADGSAELSKPLFITRIRSDVPFTMQLWVRSTEGRRYRMAYEARSGSDMVTRKKLKVRLGDVFASGVFTVLSRDVTADLARMDTAAVFDRIDRVRFRGEFELQRPRVCE